VNGRGREAAGLALLTLLGLIPRLAFVLAFPTIPFSDFRSLVHFGLHLRDHGLASPDWAWQFFSPGLPMVLAGLFGTFPGADPDAVARLATAVACGLTPLLPFLIWRGVLPLWTRLLAGALLAIWPGQVMFSGVIAQDNWVLLPTVALGALAVRALLAREGWPVMAGLLYALGVAMRQEMLVALFPPFLAAAGIGGHAGRWRRLAVAALAVGLPLLAFAAQRHAATGRFALSSQHGGLAILGSYIPGATADAWTDPYPFVASVEPALLRDRQALLAESPRLALQEALRRPVFHTARIASTVLNFAVTGEAASLYWSVGAAEVLPASHHERGVAFSARAGRPLAWEMALIQALFLAAGIVAARRRNWAILVLASAVLLKYALHAVTVSQGRYFLAATALEILAVAVAAYEVRGNRRLAVGALAAGAVLALGLFFAGPALAGRVRGRDVDGQRTYRFFLEPRGAAGASLDCVVERGRLVTLAWKWSAVIRPFQRDPAPGDVAAAACEKRGPGALTLRVHDPYAPGGLPGRVVQRVTVDGVEALAHDVAAEPGTGWSEIPLGPGTKKVLIEIAAVQPDPGAAWGEAVQTEIQLKEAR
jgi:hypothetical protein